MDDDVDIYGDLPSFDANDCGNCNKISKELSEKNANLEAEGSVWKNKCEAFEEEKKTILTNTSSLMKTARAEIARKDKIISELRRELEDLKFKRGVWSGANTKRFAPKDLRKPPAAKQNVEALAIKTISTIPVNEEWVGKTFLDHDYAQPEQQCTPNRQQVTLYGERLRKKICLEEEAERVLRRKARSPVSVAQAMPTKDPGAPADTKGNKEDIPTITRQAATEKPASADMSEEEEGEWVEEQCQQRSGSVRDQLVESKIKPVRDSERSSKEKERKESVGYVVKSEYRKDGLYEIVSEEDYERGELVDDLRDQELSAFQHERHRKADIDNCNANFKRVLHYKLTSKSSHDAHSLPPGDRCVQSDHDRKSRRHHKSYRSPLVHERRSKSGYRSHSKTPDHRITDDGKHERRRTEKREHYNDKNDKRRKDVCDKYNSKDHCNKNDNNFRDWHELRGEDKSDERGGYDNYRNYNSDDKRAGKSRLSGEKLRSGSDAAGVLNERRGIKRLRSRRHYLRPENIEKSDNRRDPKKQVSKRRKIEADDHDAVGKQQKFKSSGENSDVETASKEPKVSRTRRKTTSPHETERDLIDDDEVARETLKNPLDQVEARDKCILMLENEEVPMSPLIRPGNQPAGSCSFREEKIENIEKFIQDYQYDEAHWSVVGNDATSEQNDENNLGNSTSGIVDTLSMDMEDIVINKESHKEIPDNSKYSVDIKNSVVEHKAKNDSACHELEGFTHDGKSNGASDAGKGDITSAQKSANVYVDGKSKDGSTYGNLENIAGDKKSKNLPAEEISEHIAIDRKLDDAVADDKFERISSLKKSVDVTVCMKFEDGVVDKNSENSSNDKKNGEFDKSKEDVPTDNKEEEVFVDKKMEEVTIVKEKEIPIDKNKEEVSIEKKKNVAAEKKMEEVTIVKGKEITINKKKEEVSIGKKKDVAVEKKKEKVPIDKKKEQVVIHKKMKDVAIEKKMAEVTIAEGKEIPIEKKKEQVSIDKKKEVAVEKKKEKVPIYKKREEAFIDKKMEDVAIEKKMEEVTIVKEKEILINKKKKEVSIDKKMEEVVIENKIDEVTIVKKMEEIAIKKKTEEVTIVHKNEIVPIDKEKEKVTTYEKMVNVVFDQKAENENIEEQLAGLVTGEKSEKVGISNSGDLSTDTKSSNFVIDKTVVSDVNSSNTNALSDEICLDKESQNTMTEMISTNVAIDRKRKDNSTHERSRDAATIDQMCDNIQIHEESTNSEISTASENATIDKKSQNVDNTTMELSGAMVDHKREIVSSDRESENLVCYEKPEKSVLVKKIEDPVTDEKTSYSSIGTTRGVSYTNSATSNTSIDEKLQTTAHEEDAKRPILEILPPLPPSPQLPPLPPSPLPPSPPPEEPDISISPKSQHIKQDTDKTQVGKAVSRQTKNRPRIPCLPIVSLYSRKRRGLVLTDSVSSHTVVRSVNDNTAGESTRETPKSPQIARPEPKLVLSLVKIKHTSKSSKMQLENPTNEPSVAESVKDTVPTNSVERWNICQSKCVDANSVGNTPFDEGKPEVSAVTNDKMSRDDMNSKEEPLPDSMGCQQNSILVQGEVEDSAKKSDETQAEVQPKVDSQSIKTQRTSTSKGATISKSSERGKRSALKTIAPTVPSNEPASSNRKRPLSKEKENQSKTGKSVPVMVIRRRRPVQLQDSSTVTTLVSSEHEQVNKDNNKISGTCDGPGRKRRIVET